MALIVRAAGDGDRLYFTGWEPVFQIPDIRANLVIRAGELNARGIRRASVFRLNLAAGVQAAAVRLFDNAITLKDVLQGEFANSG